jgi:hypothetical protein
VLGAKRQKREEPSTHHEVLTLRLKNTVIHIAAIFSLFEKLEDLKYDKLSCCREN